MGIASQRYLLRLPDLADASDDDIVALVAPLLTALIAPENAS
ncbi:Putative transcriptional regulator%2C TetR family [Mycobacteroides abscessus]|nr:Putative transcriptional regulator%2C TetR family [Mycobacteroides abscessus]